MIIPHHLLIAEDENLAAMALIESLEAEGFRVTLVHNGVEALEVDEKDPAALLLTDMRMPVMGGGALIRTIRLRRADLPIIVMTGYSECLPQEVPGRLIVLRKPYSLSALAGHVRALLPHRETAEH
ncbi:response regulator [Azospirillum sp. INR13]|uniref:response regulator n=1 Tax=Azospirillum sp. INR13 TaxID=2596919 RepID=UPI001892395E|nr:response regulator [Azospirillum sp. INR13]MBF5096203.1 response regulator [Azospirillum sp. INR13]